MASRMIPLRLAEQRLANGGAGMKWEPGRTQFVVPREIASVGPSLGATHGDVCAVYVGPHVFVVMGTPEAVRAQVERAMGFHGPLDVPPESAK